jgi:hypothetical protein
MLAPGQELILRWAGKEWGDLRNWGYDLRARGTYKISAKPLVDGAQASRAEGGATSDIVEVSIER